MKQKNISKNIKGQVQIMGKGGIKQISNVNPVQPIQNYNNYNNNYNKNQINQAYPPMNQMGQMNQMYPPMNQMYPQMNQMNQMYPPMNQMNQMNPYPYWNQNNQMNNKNVYENSKRNNMNNINNNNPMVRNAQMVLNNNMNNLNHNLKNKKKSQSAKRINSINNNNNNFVNNNYGYNNINNISPPQQIKKLKDYQFMEFHPYTLKDYKELTRNPVVMGPLGANIGTKEWELKRNKMKKMMNYSNNINKEHKGIKSLKKDTPHDEIKKLTKEKIERSIRHRTYEYGKLIRTGKYKEDYEEKDFNNFNNNQNIIPEEENEDFMNKIDLNNNENNNIVINENNKSNNIEDNNIMDNNNTNNIMNENEINYGQLLKQNEEYKSKIQDIKDQLLD